MRKIFLILCTVVLAAGCGGEQRQNIRQRTIEALVDYGDAEILKGLVSSTDHSNDTIFLGFMFGMNEQEFSSHARHLLDNGTNLFFNEERFTCVIDMFLPQR